jgi:hypothetical protein
VHLVDAVASRLDQKEDDDGCGLRCIPVLEGAKRERGHLVPCGGSQDSGRAGSGDENKGFSRVSYLKDTCMIGMASVPRGTYPWVAPTSQEFSGSPRKALSSPHTVDSPSPWPKVGSCICLQGGWVGNELKNMAHPPAAEQLLDNKSSAVGEAKAAVSGGSQAAECRPPALREAALPPRAIIIRD